MAYLATVRQQREQCRIWTCGDKTCEELAAVAELERQALAMMEEARWRRRRAEEVANADDEVRTPTDEFDGVFR